MQVSALASFVCPMDGLPFVKDKNILRCSEGHVFDRAREGYYNLLLVQEKASLDPGDNKEMVAARRRFLETEKFLPIAEGLFETVSKLVGKSFLRIVDAGCGEGYYLNKLRELAVANLSSGKLELAGFDISKWAVKAAAKRTDEIAWAVASNRKLPFATKSVDLILSMFGFPIWESFRAVQPVGGRVLIVEPGPDHLIELRKIIYPSVKNKSSSTLESAIDSGYMLEKEVPLQFQANLQNSSQIKDLLTMTPHGYRISVKGRKDLEVLEKLTVSVDLVFRVLQFKT